MTQSLKPNKDSVLVQPPVRDGALKSREDKLNQRRIRWKWNLRLLWVSIAIAALVCIASVISYKYNSEKTAETFLTRAQLAEGEGRFDEQARWLERYSMLRPNDLDVIVETALAANSAAEFAEPSKKFSAADKAREFLTVALGRLGEENPEKTEELRKLLIERLLQQNGVYCPEAERQVVKLAAEPGDPQAIRWLSLALIGQVNAAIYTIPTEAQIKNAEKAGYLKQLSMEKAGEVLLEAIDVNPTDVDLIANLIAMAMDHPELFEPAFEPADGDSGSAVEALGPRIEKRLAKIDGNKDSRSVYVRYQFELNRKLIPGAKEDVEDDDQAIKLLEGVVDSAIERLENSEVEQDEDVEFWDYVLVAEFARQSLVTGNLESARKYYGQLTQCDPESVPKSKIETVFVLAGELALTQGDKNRAIGIWTDGLKVVKENRLVLLSTIANARIRLSGEEIDALAEESLRDFGKAIDSASKRISTATISQLRREVRVELKREIEAARWRMNVLNAMLNYRSGKKQEAIESFQSAMTLPADVKSQERIAVATQLANWYQRDGALDSAASALDFAVDLDLQNTNLRAQAAQLWEQAGNRLRAIENWRIVARANSPMLKIAAMEALFNYQLRLRPADRDLSGVRAAIEGFHKLKFSKDLENGSELELAISRVDAVEAQLPPVGSQYSIEQYLESPEIALTMLALAERHPDDKQLQIFAAERIAASGNVNRAKELLQKISSSSAGDEITIAVAIAHARIDARQGEFAEAYNGLVEFANGYPAEQDRLCQIAAQLALQNDDLELAFEALAKIPDSNRSLSTLSTMASIAGKLPEDSKLIQTQGLSSSEFAKKYRQKLIDREGQAGTYWRFLDATGLIEKMRTSKDPVEPDDERLINARRLVQELLVKRPRWGEAISLRGWILAIEGDLEQAIEQLYLGIDAGDRRLVSRQLLWELLIALGRNSEAVKEIELARFATDREVDKYSSQRIVLAQKQGDYSRSLELARSNAKKREGDYVAHLVHASTALVAAERANDAVGETYLEEAQSAIQAAESLVENDVLAIYSVRLSLQIAKNDKAGILKEIQLIKESKLEEIERLRLMSRGYFMVKDFDSAEPLLVQADRILPSAQSQLALAELYRNMNQPDQEIEALRLAQKLDPENPALRIQLSEALIIRQGKDVNWDELQSLLKSADGSKEINHFFYAILLSVHGDGAQKAEAIQMLRGIAEEGNSRSEDASRVLAAILKEQIPKRVDGEQLSEKNQADFDRLDSEIRSLYDALCRLRPSQSVDLYRYADFMLDHGDEQDWDRIEDIQQTLMSKPDSSLSAVEVGVRLVSKQNRQDLAPQFFEDWAAGEVSKGKLGEGEVSSIAGEKLIRMGFVDKGLEWLERAYEADHMQLGRFVATLNQVEQMDKALVVCQKHYERFADDKSIILLSETMLNSAPESVTSTHRNMVEQAVREKMKNPQLEDALLLEGVATWRMQEQEFEGAVMLYHVVDQLDPKRIRTLNNLAMAYSELPGREAQGIEPIRRAIKIAGEVPELLDTYGVVLMKSGDLPGAERAFRNANSKSEDPRFLFHQILALQAQNRNSEAATLLRELDLEKLDEKSLTPSEREKLNQLRDASKENTPTALKDEKAQ